MAGDCAAPELLDIPEMKVLTHFDLINFGRTFAHVTDIAIIKRIVKNIFELLKKYGVVARITRNLF